MSDTLDFETKYAAGDEGTFEGYASIFGGSPDRVGDVVAPGAFTAALAEHKARGTSPAILWAHNHAEPIGVLDEVSEDAKGLKVKGRIVLETKRGREVHALMKVGGLSGLSIGYRTREFERRPHGRLLKRVDLHEISAVAIPAHPNARVSAVKSLSDAQRERALAGAIQRASAALARL